MRSIVWAVCGLLTLICSSAGAQKPRLAVAPGWGVFARLAGTSWSDERGGLTRWTWKERGETLVADYVTAQSTTQVEYRLSFDEGSLVEMEAGSSALRPVGTPSRASFQLNDSGGKFRIGCRLNEVGDTLLCEEAGLGGRTAFVQHRVTAAAFAAKLREFADQHQATAHAASAQAAKRAELLAPYLEKYGLWATLIDVDGESPTFGTRDFIVKQGGRDVGAIRFAWKDDPKYGNILTSTLINFNSRETDVQALWRVSPKTGQLEKLIRTWGWAVFPEREANRLATPSNYWGEAEEYRLDSGSIVRQTWKTKKGEKRVYTDEVWVPAAPGGYEDMQARIAAAKQASKSSGGGLLGVLGTVAEGTAVAVGSYSNAYNGGSLAGAGGVENPLNPNTSQNRAFQQNLQQFGQRAEADAAAARTSGATTANGRAQVSSGANRSLPPAATRPMPPAPSVSATTGAHVRYFGCLSIRRKTLEDRSSAIDSVSYGVVTSTRDTDEVWAEFKRRTSPTASIDSENGAGGCSPDETMAAAQQTVRAYLDRDRTAKFAKRSGVDFSY